MYYWSLSIWLIAFSIMISSCICFAVSVKILSCYMAEQKSTVYVYHIFWHPQ